MSLVDFPSSTSDLGGILLEQVQLQRLVQVQFAVAPALQQVSSGRLHPLQQRRHFRSHALEVRSARQPATVATATAVAGCLAVGGAQTHALQ